MLKSLQFLLIVLILTAGCGQKSNIKSSVAARPLKADLPVVVSLTEEEMGTFNSPMENLQFFIAGGFAKMFMNLGASLGVGNKIQFTLVQHLPPLPADKIKHIKIKRVLFYIEPTEGERRRNWIERKLFGEENVDFHFINKLAVKVSPTRVENTDSWKPSFEAKEISKREFSPMQELFEPKVESIHDVNVTDPSQEIVLLKYSKQNKDNDLTNALRGKTYIIYSNNPKETRDFLDEHPKLHGYFKRLHILNKSVLLAELNKDPVIEEGFNVILSQEAQAVTNLGIEMLDACTTETCLDFKVTDENLLSMLIKDNAIRMDGYIEVGKVPASFKLKGFVEFDFEAKLSF